MTILTQDFHFNSDNSHARMSLRKTAELLKVSVEAISNAIRRVNLDFSETAENLVQYGIDGVNLAVLVEYYAFDSRQAKQETKDQCRRLYRQAAAKSFQTVIDTLAGIPEPTPQNTSVKYLVGTWEEERELQKVPRKSFDDLVYEYTGSRDSYQYGKYTNKIYQGLFGCNAETLKNLPVVAGVKSIGRNHIQETHELTAVGQAEALVVDLFESAKAMGYSLSLTRTIVFACHAMKRAFTTPHLGKSKSKATVIYQMLSKPSDKEIQHYLESIADEFDF